MREADCRRPFKILLGVMLIAFVSPRFAAKTSSAVDEPLLYTLSDRYEPLAWMDGEDRFPVGATIFLRTGGSKRPLVHNFADSADGQLLIVIARTRVAQGQNRCQRCRRYPHPWEWAARRSTPG